jgi:hypothetical protein
VASNVDDVEFIFDCVCVGGNEVTGRWLLGLDGEPPADETLFD